MGRHLANRKVYNHFKDCSTVKSHKLSGLVEKNCVSLEFTDNLLEPDIEVFKKIPTISKQSR